MSRLTLTRTLGEPSVSGASLPRPQLEGRGKDCRRPGAPPTDTEMLTLKEQPSYMVGKPAAGNDPASPLRLFHLDLGDSDLAKQPVVVRDSARAFLSWWISIEDLDPHKGRFGVRYLNELHLWILFEIHFDTLSIRELDARFAYRVHLIEAIGAIGGIRFAVAGDDAHAIYRDRLVVFEANPGFFAIFECDLPGGIWLPVNGLLISDIVIL